MTQGPCPPTLSVTICDDEGTPLFGPSSPDEHGNLKLIIPAIPEHVPSTFMFEADGDGGFTLSHDDGDGNIVTGSVTHSPSTFEFVDNGDGTTSITHTDGAGVTTTGTVAGPVTPDSLTAVANPDGSITVTHTPINGGVPTSFTIPAPSDPSAFSFTVNPDGSISLAHDDGNGTITTGTIPAGTDSDASVAAGGEATTHQGAANTGDILITLDNGDVVAVPAGTTDTDSDATAAVGGEATTHQGPAAAGDTLINLDNGDVVRVPKERHARRFERPFAFVVDVDPNSGVSVPAGTPDTIVDHIMNFADGSVTISTGGVVPPVDLDCHNSVIVKLNAGSSHTGGWPDGTVVRGSASAGWLNSAGELAGGTSLGTGGLKTGQAAGGEVSVADNDANNDGVVMHVPLDANGVATFRSSYFYFGGGATIPSQNTVFQVIGYSFNDWELNPR